MNRWLAGCGLVFGWVIGLGAAPIGSERWNDACLRAVYFVDLSEGWAVGDDGVVWHSIDGGSTWERQATGTRASLRAVHFITPFVGWIVGREERPDGTSVGVVLATADGGIRWTRLAWNTLPGLHAVRFFDEKTGIVAGETHDRYSSGVFLTQDGGRTWKIIGGPRQISWLAADLESPERGTLVGVSGTLARLGQSISEISWTDPDARRDLRSIARTSKRFLAVGPGGLILSSPLDQEQWTSQTPGKGLPEWYADCNFNAVCAVGDSAWVVGRPGSIILKTTDAGQSWSPHFTGQSLPLHAVYFYDSQNGWAVGELGTILTTTDGGKSWQIRRQGGQRLAVLIVHPTITSSPLDRVAELGAEGGYLVGLLQVARTDPQLSADRAAREINQALQSVRAVGGAACESLWQFPLASFDTTLNAPDLLDVWDRLHRGAGRSILVRQLVLALRIWQPELVLSRDGLDGPNAIVFDALREAWDKAADPAAFPEQLRHLGLKVCSARRWFIEVQGRADPSPAIPVSSSDPLPRIGESPLEMAQMAADLSGLAWLGPASRSYRLETSRIDNDRPQSLLDGIILAHGGTARREQVTITAEEVKHREDHLLVTRRCQTIEKLARSGSSQLLSPDQLVTQLSELTRGLPPDRAVLSLWRLARQFATSGRWSLAQDTFEWLVERHPTHPLSVEAYRWLVCYAASAEARRRHELTQTFRQVEYQIKPGATDSTQGQRAMTGPDQALPDALIAQRRGWHAAALPLEKRMAALGSLDLHDPRFQFALQSARRSLGESAAARSWMSTFLAEAPASDLHRDPWREAAAAELWLTQRGTLPKRPVAHCSRFAEKPRLDGKLDDACWSNASVLTLDYRVGRLETLDQTQVRWGFDSEYIYIAIDCRHAAGRHVPKSEHRRRDEDLTRFDRVSILLDIDRDYQSCFHLQVDQRGCVFEECWGDATWDPKWFVAHSSNETGWIIEAAMPLAELTSELPSARTAWACQVTRIMPGRGLQSWSWPADATPVPQGMGLLLFSERAK